MIATPFQQWCDRFRPYHPTGALVAWQARAVLRSPRPALRAAAALTISFTLLVVLFATAYTQLVRNDPGAFTEPMSRIDTLYFTVTVFSTVGLGDIAPRSELVRALVTVQMVVDLAFVGLAVRMILAAAQLGHRRQRTHDRAGPAGRG